MKFTITQIIESMQSWERKRFGVILVDKVENIDTVLQYLIEQDDTWENYKDLVKVAPASIVNERDLTRLCKYSGKTDIYEENEFFDFCKSKNIDVFLYQTSLDEED